MRIKKLISTSINSFGQPSRYCCEVELNPIDDDKQFVETNKVAYKLHFPHLNSKMLLDISRNPYVDWESINKYNYTVSFEVPKALCLSPFINLIMIYKLDYPYDGTTGSKNEGRCVFGIFSEDQIFNVPVKTYNFSIFKDKFDANLAKKGNYSTFLIMFGMTNNYLEQMSNITEPLPDDKLKTLEFIRRKNFMQEHHLGRILKNEENFRDFKILAGNFEIQVHKVVLAAQSSVFKQMLLVPMDESQNSVLKIIDIPQDSVRIAIDFMYLGEIDLGQDNNIGEILGGLYIFAQKYDMVNLKWSVFEKCYNNLDYFKQNLGEKHRILQIATLHETNTNDWNSFLAIFGPYSVVE